MPNKSKLSIKTTKFGLQTYTIYTISTKRNKANSIDQLLYTSIYIQERSAQHSTIAISLSIASFSSTLSKVFSSTIGQQLLRREQLGLLSFCSTIVVVHQNSLEQYPILKHTWAILAKWLVITILLKLVNYSILIAKYIYKSQKER